MLLRRNSFSPNYLAAIRRRRLQALRQALLSFLEFKSSMGELRIFDTSEIASFIQLLHTSAASGEGSLASDVVFDN
jgi:hypothetical protein